MNEWTPGPTDAWARIRTSTAGGMRTRTLTDAKTVELGEPAGTALRNEGPAIVRVRREVRSRSGRTVGTEKIAELEAGAEIRVPEAGGGTVCVDLCPSAVAWNRADVERTKGKDERATGEAGENLIRRYLKKRGSPVERIPEGVDRGADFKVSMGGIETIWEAKTLCGADPDSAPFEDTRFRVKTNDARRGSRRAEKAQGQVKRSAPAGTPTVLALIDLREEAARNPYTDEMIAQHLYGNRTAAMAEDGAARETVREHETCPKLAGLSAVAVLTIVGKQPECRRILEEEGGGHADVPLIAEMTVYHNRGAAVPLPPEAAAAAGLDQKFFETGAGGGSDRPLVTRLIPVRRMDGRTTIDPPPGAETDTGAELPEGEEDRMIRLTERLSIDFPEADLGPEQDALLVDASGRVREDEDAGRALRTMDTDEKVANILRRMEDALRAGAEPSAAGSARTALECAETNARSVRLREPGDETAGRVERRKDVCSGDPVIKGTRIKVEWVFGMLADGRTSKEICRELNLAGHAAEIVADCVGWARRAVERYCRTAYR